LFLYEVMFKELKEEIRSYIEWNKPAFIVYLIMAGLIVSVTVASIAGGGHVLDVDACKTRCGH
jgi:hypothetical protein